MYYSYVAIEYVATSFSPARTYLALKLLRVFVPPTRAPHQEFDTIKLVEVVLTFHGNSYIGIKHAQEKSPFHSSNLACENFLLTIKDSGIEAGDVILQELLGQTLTGYHLCASYRCGISGWPRTCITVRTDVK
jgi:hypothetical protein